MALRTPITDLTIIDGQSAAGTHMGYVRIECTISVLLAELFESEIDDFIRCCPNLNGLEITFKRISRVPIQCR